MSLGMVIRLITVLGPKFKEVLPILLEIIQLIKGVSSENIPGFSPGPTVTPEEAVKRMEAGRPRWNY